MGGHLYTLLGLAMMLTDGPMGAEAGSEQVAARDTDDEPPSGGSISTTLGEAPFDTSNIQWARSYGYQCRSYRGRRVCDGPRRVPEPSGPAAALANELELGRRPTASALMREGPRSEWVEAVTGQSPETLLWPVEGGELSRGLGYVSSGSRRRLHKGFDINADEGTPIRAVADGLVAYSDNGMRGYGNLLIVIHADATVGLYSHCRAIYVFAGQQVRAGQVVGEVGHTGNAMGPHLHFELRAEGRPQDPYTAFDEVTCRRARYCQALERYHRLAEAARAQAALRRQRRR